MLYFEKRDIMSQFFDSMENELDQSNAREDPLIKFAKEQLDDGFYDDSYTESIKKDTLELITIFAKQRHSGLGATLTTTIFDRLVNFLPLSPLTGEDDEWSEPTSRMAVGEYIDMYMQSNKKCPRVMRDVYIRKDTDEIEYIMAYDTEAEIYSYDDGKTWKSSVTPIDFPYYPELNPTKIIKKKQ